MAIESKNKIFMQIKTVLLQSHEIKYDQRAEDMLTDFVTGLFETEQSLRGKQKESFDMGCQTDQGII